MIRRLRRCHRWLWVVLAVLLPVLFLAALIARTRPLAPIELPEWTEATAE